MKSAKCDRCCNRLAFALAKRNIKQSELCKRTGIPKSAMSLYLSGAYEPKAERIRIISNALNINETWLLGYDVPMEQEKIQNTAERIKELIEQSGKSYQELEAITGIKKSSLQRYASGTTKKIPLEVIEKIATTFDVPKELMVGWSDKKEQILTDRETILLDLFRKTPDEKQLDAIELFRAVLRIQQ